eukprot:CAMPEP_0198370290 /NCGR_PEP_ID=MMETSP1450-20131203/156640_1 /TAXON_ID=753684 ORGANISM="Madagascaria erythrocladiodes, Strain CCMP3234" /NCGR_SAMPLE_ID=MMETSP1450 /ASSEMBLY_ACC=CAM_ASM_001115 /LENGTH=880 /DNA_ID=CAMNT_0044077825 /DNA_START=594 /DNA_END=3236 /DNA_ORIENTATION=-
MESSPAETETSASSTSASPQQYDSKPYQREEDTDRRRNPRSSQLEEEGERVKLSAPRQYSSFYETSLEVMRAIWLSERSGKSRKQNDPEERRWSQRAEIFCRNHSLQIAGSAVLLAANIVMFVWGLSYAPYADNSSLVKTTARIAKGTGRMLSFDLGVIILTACRFWLTHLRGTQMNKWFPFNSIHALHRILAYALLTLGLIHSLCHIITFSLHPEVVTPGLKWLDRSNGGLQFLITGSLLMMIFLAILASASKSVRSTSAGFRVFNYLHRPLFYLAAFSVLFHSTAVTGYLTALPLFLYVTDTLCRSFWRVFRGVKVLSYETDEAQKYVRLEVERPENFYFKAGQFVELKHPDISRSEYHPFTIASAPEDNTLVFIIQAAGRWTSALLDMAVTETGNPSPQSVLSLRGPHGAPAQGFKGFRNVILVASGAGISPTMSVYLHIVNNQFRRPITPEEAVEESCVHNGVPCVEETEVAETNEVGEFDIDALDSDYDRRTVPGSRNVFGQTPGRFASRLLADVGAPAVQTARGQSFSMAQISGVRASMTLQSKDLRDEQKSGRITTRILDDEIGISSALFIEVIRSLTTNVVLALLALTFGTTWTAFALWSMRNPARTVVELVLMSVLLPFNLSIFIPSVLEFGGLYYKTSFFVFDLLSASANAVAVLASAVVVAMSDRANGAAITIADLSLIATCALTFARMLHMVYKSAAPTDHWIEKDMEAEQKRLFRRRSDGAGTIERADLVWVTPTLPNAKWLTEEVDKKASEVPQHWLRRFYFSQESEQKVNALNRARLASIGAGCTNLATGRPDWVALLREALQECHRRGDNRPLGVFFCGSPAVSSAIKAAALQVELEHSSSHAIGAITQRSCLCRIVVHEEHFW